MDGRDTERLATRCSHRVEEEHTFKGMNLESGVGESGKRPLSSRH